MKRASLILSLSLSLASACRAAPPSDGGSQVSTPPTATASEVVAADPLPSWKEGKTKQSIVDFVTKVTTEGSPDFVPVAERIATFDNDGTLWGEKPLPFQLVFAFDRVKELAPQHPEWKSKQPFAALLKGDMAGVLASGTKGVFEIVLETHSGMTTDEFDAAVRGWLGRATHPVTKKHYTEMVYQPMLELLAYLRSHGFKTFIVSGGGIEFMRVWAEEAYGIPPEQVIGSTGKLKLDNLDGKPVLVKLPELEFFDDRGGKVIAIQSRIGRRPIAAFGNSDGDLAMLQWVMAGTGPRFALFVHHDDAEREFAYDRADALARLNDGWDEAIAKGWTVVSMKNDWATVYPPEAGKSPPP